MLNETFSVIFKHRAPDMLQKNKSKASVTCSKPFNVKIPVPVSGYIVIEWRANLGTFWYDWINWIGPFILTCHMHANELMETSSRQLWSTDSVIQSQSFNHRGHNLKENELKWLTAHMYFLIINWKALTSRNSAGNTFSMNWNTVKPQRLRRTSTSYSY